MRLVGALLTSAFIIFPAISAMRVFKSYKSVTICAVAIAVFCALSGIFTAILAGTPVGSTIVIANLTIFALFYIIGMFTRRFL
jgi:zinc transport system permease protein